MRESTHTLTIDRETQGAWPKRGYFVGSPGPYNTGGSRRW
jgi:hypothetical protein